MDERLRVRKAPSLLSSVRQGEEARRRAAGGRSLVEEVEGASGSAPGPGPETWPLRHRSLAPPQQQRCALCRQHAAQYNCPQCNVPYCSLSCYQAPQHAACARPFADAALRNELGAAAAAKQHERATIDADDDEFDLHGEGGGSGPRASEEERKKMMDVLRRLRTLGQLGQEGEPDVGGADGLDSVSDEDASGNGTAPTDRDLDLDLDRERDIDLETASTDELLRLLTPDERARFAAIVSDRDPNQERARAFLEKLVASQGPTGGKEVDAARKPPPASAFRDAQPWWMAGLDASDTATYEAKEPVALRGFGADAATIQQSLPPRPSPLEWNVVSVLLAYAYTLRHLGISSLHQISKHEIRPLRGMQDTSTDVRRESDQLEASSTSAVEDDEFADMPPLEPADIDTRGRSSPLNASQQGRAPSEGQGARALSISAATSSTRNGIDYEAEDCKVALGLMQRLVPFLFANARSRGAGTEKKGVPTRGSSDVADNAAGLARVMLGSSEEATLWILSHLGFDAGMQSATTLRFLYGDVQQLLAAPLVQVEAPRRPHNDTTDAQHEPGRPFGSRVQSALADVHALLPKHAQRKLVFYAAVWAKRQQLEAGHVRRAFETEVARLDAEIQRSEDEERWRAAHEAVAQNDGVVLPM